MTMSDKPFAVCRVVLLAVLLAATLGSSGPRAIAQERPPAAGATTQYPLVVRNCDVDLTLKEAPKRVIVMEPATIAILSPLGVLDRVVARIGSFPTDYFTDDENAAIAAIPELVSEQTSTGGAAISLEAVLDLSPDLVIGYETETITRAALARFGITLSVIPPYCATPPAPSFARISAEVRLYGQMFDRNEEAETLATTLEQRVAEVSARPVATGEKAAALYVSSDGSAIYGYSKLGMVDVQMQALGLTNIYADLPERVSEVNVESLIAGQPDVLILLYTDASSTPEAVKALVTDLPGASTIPAVQKDGVYPLLFNYSEPPSPLAIDGLILLQELLAP